MLASTKQSTKDHFVSIGEETAWIFKKRPGFWEARLKPAAGLCLKLRRSCTAASCSNPFRRILRRNADPNPTHSFTFIHLQTRHWPALQNTEIVADIFWEDLDIQKSLHGSSDSDVCRGWGEGGGQTRFCFCGPWLIRACTRWGLDGQCFPSGVDGK